MQKYGLPLQSWVISENRVPSNQSNCRCCGRKLEKKNFFLFTDKPILDYNPNDPEMEVDLSDCCLNLPVSHGVFL